MSRVADEKKAWDAFRKAVSGFDWNPGSFAANLVYENPLVQVAVWKTIRACIEAMHGLYLNGSHDHRNADAMYEAYLMHSAVQPNE